VTDYNFKDGARVRVVFEGKWEADSAFGPRVRISDGPNYISFTSASTLRHATSVEEIKPPLPTRSTS
jgi:hypothetical protein